MNDFQADKSGVTCNRILVSLLSISWLNHVHHFPPWKCSHFNFYRPIQLNSESYLPEPFFKALETHSLPKISITHKNPNKKQRKTKNPHIYINFKNLFQSFNSTSIKHKQETTTDSINRNNTPQTQSYWPCLLACLTKSVKYDDRPPQRTAESTIYLSFYSTVTICLYILSLKRTTTSLPITLGEKLLCYRMLLQRRITNVKQNNPSAAENHVGKSLIPFEQKTLVIWKSTKSIYRKGSVDFAFFVVNRKQCYGDRKQSWLDLLFFSFLLLAYLHTSAVGHTKTKYIDILLLFSTIIVWKIHSDRSSWRYISFESGIRFDWVFWLEVGVRD